MQFNLPPKVRQALYVLIVVSAPVVTYLSDKNYVGTLEVALYAGLVSAISLLAALNVSQK